MALGEDVRRLRKLRGLSLEALAERANLSTNYVGSIEKNQRDPSLSSIKALAAALGVSLASILSDKAAPASVSALEAARLFDRLPARTQEGVLGLLQSLVPEKAAGNTKGRTATRRPPRA